MRKYITIAKMVLINNLQYVWDMLLGSVHFMLMIFIFVNLWNYLYGTGKTIIAGYDITQMVWYLIITELITIGTKTSVTRGGISEDVKTGNIAYMLNKPIHYIYYQFASFMGEVMVKFVLYVPLSLLVGFVMIGELKNFNIVYLPMMIFIVILATVIDFFFRVAVGLLAFWMEDTNPLFWMYNKFLLAFGVFFPSELFPKMIADIVKASPIAAIVYGPGKIVVDFSIDTFIRVLFTQITYLVIASALVFYIYQKGVKKLNVNGG